MQYQGQRGMPFQGARPRPTLVGGVRPIGRVGVSPVMRVGGAAQPRALSAPARQAQPVLGARSSSALGMRYGTLGNRPPGPAARLGSAAVRPGAVSPRPAGSFRAVGPHQTGVPTKQPQAAAGVKRSIGQVAGAVASGPAPKAMRPAGGGYTKLPVGSVFSVKQATPGQGMSTMAARELGARLGRSARPAFGTFQRSAMAKAPQKMVAKPPSSAPPSQLLPKPGMNRLAGVMRTIQKPKQPPGTIVGRPAMAGSVVGKPAKASQPAFAAGRSPLAGTVVGGKPAKAAQSSRPVLGSVVGKPAKAAQPKAPTGPIVKRDPAEIKSDVKMRKVEAMTKQLVAEFVSLAEDRRDNSWNGVIEMFVKKVPGKYLAMMAHTLNEKVDAADLEAGSEALARLADSNAEAEVKAELEAAAKADAEAEAAAVAAEEAAAAEAEALAAEAEAEAAAAAAAEADSAASTATAKPVEVKKELSGVTQLKKVAVAKSAAQAQSKPAVDPKMYEVKEPERFSEAMKKLLAVGPAEQKNAWSAQKIAVADQSSALVALGQAAAEEGEMENVCVLLTTLVTSKMIPMIAVEAALAELAQRLDELILANDSAWHLHSQCLYHFFPRTDQCKWGFFEKSWSWATWWQMVEKVLSKADSFRAFEILVLVLQMTQDSSGSQLKDLQIWRAGDRLVKVKEALAAYSELEEDTLMETIAAYGVEISK